MHTLTIAAAPIDFHAGDAVIHDYVQLLSPADLGSYQDVKRLSGGVMKGEFMLNASSPSSPENEIAKHLQLLANIHDGEDIKRHRAFEDWFKHTQDIPGAFYLWIVEHLFRDNALIRGELTVGDARVDLRRTSCPLNLLAGETGHVTAPPKSSPSPAPCRPRRSSSSSVRRAAGTSGCSWEVRPCASTSGRSSPTSSSARRPARTRAAHADVRPPPRQSTGIPSALLDSTSSLR